MWSFNTTKPSAQPPWGFLTEIETSSFWHHVISLTDQREIIFSFSDQHVFVFLHSNVLVVPLAYSDAQIWFPCSLTFRNPGGQPERIHFIFMSRTCCFTLVFPSAWGQMCVEQPEWRETAVTWCSSGPVCSCRLSHSSVKHLSISPPGTQHYLLFHSRELSLSHTNSPLCFRRIGHSCILSSSFHLQTEIHRGGHWGGPADAR